MTTLTFGGLRPATPHRSVWSRVGALAGGLRTEWANRRAEHALSGFDDALLRDIGIGRAEIGDAVRHGRPQR